MKTKEQVVIEDSKKSSFIVNFNKDLYNYFFNNRNVPKQLSVSKHYEYFQNGSLTEEIKNILSENKSYYNKRKEIKESINENYLELNDIQKFFGKHKILNGVNLKLKRGERAAIIGHNGSGKTTLVEIITGLRKANSGTINYNFAYSKDDLGSKIAIQFQKLNYPEGYRVNEVIKFFNWMVDKRIRYSKSEFNKLLNVFGINQFYRKSIVSISGGQQQRVNLFLSFIKKPTFLVLDELSAGLDIDIYEKVLALFEAYVKENNVTLLIVSHNLSEIRRLTDYVYLLKDGIIAEKISSKDLTDDMFFELIRRKQTPSLFEFDFSTKKEYKEGYLEKLINFSKYRLPLYYKEIESIQNIMLSNYKNNLESQVIIDDLVAKNTLFRQNIDNNNEKRHEKMSSVIKKTDNFNETKKINSVLKEEIKQIETENKKIQKKFSVSIKNQIKLETKKQEKEIKILNFYNEILRLFAVSKTKIHNKISKINDFINDYKEIIDNPNYVLDEKESTKSKKITQSKIENYKNKLDDYKVKLESVNNIEKKFLNFIATTELKYLSSQNRSINENLIIKDLRKYYLLKPVVDGVNLKIKSGERIALTGPNGSGKTTLAEIISTTLDKTTGTILYWFTKNNKRAKHEIGMQFQESIFPQDYKVKEIINLFFNISMWTIKRKELDELIKIFKLDHVLNHRGDVLSGGERQRLNILIALLKRPSLLILDEISTGLDVESIIDINNYIKEYLDKTNSTLILISHNPEEVKRLVDSIYIMDEGKIIKHINIKNKSINKVKKIFNDIYSDINEELSVKEILEKEGFTSSITKKIEKGINLPSKELKNMTTSLFTKNLTFLGIKNVTEYDDKTISEIKKELDSLNVSYYKNLNKKQLIDLLIYSKKNSKDNKKKRE